MIQMILNLQSSFLHYVRIYYDENHKMQYKSIVTLTVWYHTNMPKITILCNFLKQQLLVLVKRFISKKCWT